MKTEKMKQLFLSQITATFLTSPKRDTFTFLQLHLLIFFPNREITQNNLKRIGNKSIFAFEPVLFTSFHQVRTAHPWSGPDGKAINFSSGRHHKDVLSGPRARKLNRDFRYYKIKHGVQKLLAFKVEWCSKLQAKFQLFKACRKQNFNRNDSCLTFIDLFPSIIWL